MSTEESVLINDCYRLAIKLTQEAGEFVKEGYGAAEKTIDTKTNKWDIVTEYDGKVEDVLLNGIRAKYPHHKFLAEESQANTELTNEPTWIIDPIDGTINFIHQNPMICISVALAIRKRIVIGIIYNPIHNEFYRASIGHGTYLNDKQIFCSKVEELKKAIYAHEFTFILPEIVRMKNLRRIYRFSTIAQGSRCLGSAALTLAYVAKGAFDAYDVDDLKPWDIAAGTLLITEAGGSVYSVDGGPLNIMKPNVVCAATEKLCRELLDGIAECVNWNFVIEKI